MKPYRWATPGDVNAFFGLALDNIANLALTIGLLTAGFGFPAKFALTYMIPGTALGVLVGDLWFTWMAFRLAARTGRPVTAMPLGLDTPSTIGTVLFVLGPAFLDAQGRGLDPEQSAHFAWRIGTAAIVLSGAFKLICALGSGWIRRLVPRAGLLGSLTAVALVLISFLPLLEILRSPIVGLVSLAIVLATLTAGLRLPLRIPGALAATLVGVTVYYAMIGVGWLPQTQPAPSLDQALSLNPPWPSLGWLIGMSDALPYLPVVLPFALATVVGGIDCTESAAAAGDEYETGQVIAVEAVATLVAGICGGVIQTTPYIGHPAYKAMGGRALYTLATALFIGAAGIFGYFSLIYAFIPKAAIFPILIFIGLEITAQSFRVTPRRHYPAAALACIPALAYLVMMFVDSVAGPSGIAKLASPIREQVHIVRVLAGGFILTSLIWASILAALIDQNLRRATGFCLAASALTLFGVIHSPFAGNSLFLPWALPGREWPATVVPMELAGAYVIVAALFGLWSLLPGTQPGQITAEADSAPIGPRNNEQPPLANDPDGI